MTNYEKQAREFLKANNAKMKISFKDYGKYFDGDKDYRNIYRVRIDRNGKTFSFNFGDSVNSTQNGTRPGRYDILACLQKYDVYGDVWDFASEFGYEIDCKDSYKRVERTYKAVKREFAGVKRVFGDVLEELQEIG